MPNASGLHFGKSKFAFKLEKEVHIHRTPGFSRGAREKKTATVDVGNVITYDGKFVNGKA